jgi:hypothetical protein
VNLVNASTQLGQGLKVARAIWDETRAGWQDAIAEDFAKNHWSPLNDQVTNTVEAVDRLAPVLERLYRECS